MKVLGGILIGAGILLCGLSGLCTLTLVLEELTVTYSQTGEWMAVIALVGGIPFLVGLGMIFGGWKLVQRKPGN
ncbi:MAG: hypothetical protein AB7F98_17245 [Novosphingobium sp.]